MASKLPTALRPMRFFPALSSASRNFTKSVRPSYAASTAASPAPKPAARPAATKLTRSAATKTTIPPPKQSYPPRPGSDLAGIIDPQAAIGAPPASADPIEPNEPPPNFEPIPEPSPQKGPAANNQYGNNSGVTEQGASGNGNGETVDWGNSFHGLSTVPFPAETARTLMQALSPDDVEVKPDGIIYLPEIKYRRILNQSFGPGGWGLAPRGDLLVADKIVSRPYALVVHGRFIAEARGECQFMFQNSIATAGEGAKSNALMRCCKDLGIAAELWDPRFIRRFKKEHCHEVWVEHNVSKQKRKIWLRKDCDPQPPFKIAPSKF